MRAARESSGLVRTFTIPDGTPEPSVRPITARARVGTYVTASNIEQYADLRPLSSISRGSFPGVHIGFTTSVHDTEVLAAVSGSTGAAKSVRATLSEGPEAGNARVSATRARRKGTMVRNLGIMEGRKYRHIFTAPQRTLPGHPHIPTYGCTKLTGLAVSVGRVR